MFNRTSLLSATALALSVGLATAAANAASITDTVQQHKDLGTFAKAMAGAALGEQLSGEGPYTVFAPTDQAFQRLPQGALDQLMKQENRAQLTKLLEHHVVRGQEIAAADVVGQQKQVDTMAGDTLTVDGNSQAVLLVPTGLTVTRIGDQVVVEREGIALSKHAIRVEDQVVRKAGGEQQGQGQQQRQSQEQAQGQQQAEGQQQAATRTATAEQSDMPMTQHQQQVLESEPKAEQQQTAAQGSTPVPATEHQQQVLAEEEMPGEQQQSYEQARVEGKPDVLREAVVITAGVEADNGVIHVIDAVLVPQEVLKTLESAKQGQG